MIGDDVTIYQCVTLGGTSPDNGVGGKRHPTLLDGAIIGSGAQVLGPITVGRRSRVGANAVVTRDVPEGAVMVGIPARPTMVEGGQAPERRFVPYGTPCSEMFDPATQQVEILRCELEAMRKRLDALLDEVKNMIRLVNGLLELARANTGFPNLLPKYPVRLDELLWQAQSQLIHKKSDYQIDIDFADLPNQEDDLVVMGDESLLQTAFLNLMENGCKYSPNHAVTVRLAFQPQQVQITVSDQGYGIPSQYLPNIFEPFYRSDSTMTVSGHGIGLALTKRIINIHQGTIDVESTLGKGTTFRVCLPNRVASDTSAAPVLAIARDSTALPEH